MNTQAYIARACRLRALRERLDEYQMHGEAPFIRAEISKLEELQNKERAKAKRRERWLRYKERRKQRSE